MQNIKRQNIPMDKMSKDKMSKDKMSPKTECSQDKMSPLGYILAPRNCPEDSTSRMVVALSHCKWQMP